MPRKRNEAKYPYIAESLQHLAVPIDSVAIDPANARVHTRVNLAAIRGSLRKFGQRKPIVVNRRTGVVEAGNGTVQAALQEGWTHIAAVYVDDDPADAAAFAIADNRSAELAEWDVQALGALLADLRVEDADLQRMLEDLAKEYELNASAGDASDGQKLGTVAPGPEELRYQILIDCRDEKHQKELLERFAAEGLECKALFI